MSMEILAALEAQNRAAVAEVADALLVARAACMLALLQFRVPEAVFAKASLLVVLPEIERQKMRGPGVVGFAVRRADAVWASVTAIRLEGPAVDNLQGHVGLVLVSVGEEAAQKLLSGGTLSADPRVCPGPAINQAFADEDCILCWLFGASGPIGAIIHDAHVVFDHALSDRCTAGLLGAVQNVCRRAEHQGPVS